MAINVYTAHYHFNCCHCNGHLSAFTFYQWLNKSHQNSLLTLLQRKQAISTNSLELSKELRRVFKLILMKWYSQKIICKPAHTNIKLCPSPFCQCFMSIPIHKWTHFPFSKCKNWIVSFNTSVICYLNTFTKYNIYDSLLGVNEI